MPTLILVNVSCAPRPHGPTAYDERLKNMSQKFSNSKISRLPRRKTYGIALLQVIVIIIAAVNPAQPNLLAQEKGGQRPEQERFQATPLYPTSTIVKSAAEKSAALEGGWDRSAAITAPDQVAACSPAISIAPGTSPGGYLPLSGFGVPPVPGPDDDTVTNFTVPAYSYGGQTYTTIGMASNGYAVVGGGNSTDDNTFVNQLFPNPVRPNNVLAPFWTDLLPSAGGALRIATLTDGMDTWIVLDWAAVKYFSTTDTVSFEIWIGINSDAHPVEDITYPYGPISGAGNNNALTVGAENAFGDRGANRYFSFFGKGSTGTLPANGTELRVSSSTPASCLNQGAETAIGLTASNELLAIGSTGSEAMTLWDIHSHERLLTLEAKVGGLRPTAFSPDGNVIAGESGAGATAGTLYFWRAPTWAEIEKAEAAGAKGK